MSDSHYSYTVYADPATARTFDERRFGGPIGGLVADEQAAVLLKFLQPLEQRTILDVGTGTGRAALLLARNGASVTGIDASEEMLSVARQRAAAENMEIAFRSGDAHALDVPDRAVDAVVSLRVLMHTPRWRTALGELCRVSKRLVVFDYPSASSVARLESIVRRLGYALGARTEPYRVFSLKEIQRALGESGFQVRSIHRQFVLPIALHKAIGSRRFTTAVERSLERLGLLRTFGSPVTILAERCAPS